MKKLTITGNVGKDPELISDLSGSYFAVFPVGISTGSKGYPKTDWVQVSCNGKMAEMAHNCIRKGTKVLIEGYPKVHPYLDKASLPSASLRLYAHTLELLSWQNRDTIIYDPNEGIDVANELSEDESIAR